MISPQTAIVDRLKSLGVEEEIVFNTPPRPEMGDFSTPVSLKLAKPRRKAPLLIAEELRRGLCDPPVPYIRTVTVSPPGFLNFFLDDRAYAADLIQEALTAGDDYASVPPRSEGKALVEHTNVNPNKAMHVGHVRNAVLGDTIVRVLRKSGFPVEVCNYIDDTGVQVVDVVTAMLYLDDPVYAGDGDFRPVWDRVDPDQPFDYYCWDLYARCQAYLKPAADDSLSPADLDRSRAMRTQKEEVMHAVETPGHPIAVFAKELATRIVRAHLASISRLNVFYDLLNWESDILGAGFWSTTFERLRESGAIQYEQSGPNAGCWVVPMGGIVETPQGPRSLDRILVRSNGAATYTAKDIAYQLWKFGRLDADFRYRLWDEQANGHPLWTTAPDGASHPGFGHASRVINVIDTRQSEPQTVVYTCLERLGFKEEASNCRHLGYEVVKLTASAARELGVDVEETEDVNMSGRRGLGVKADDLVNRLMGVIRAKNSDPSLDAEALAAAAVRYYMLRFSINTIITFDFEMASQTNGDSGVYLVYSYARACNILSRVGADPSAVSTLVPVVVPEELLPEEKSLLEVMGRLGEAVQQAAETLTTTPLTTYAFTLASAFASFYDHTPPIVRETDPAIKQFRISLVAAYRQVMKNTLDVLGIPALERI